MNTYRPIEPDSLVRFLVDRIDALPGRVRVAIDGPRGVDPAGLADRLVSPLLARSRPTLVIRAEYFWRDAALRLEQGRQDVDSYYYGWLDAAALQREALCSAAVLPSLRNPISNRSTREPPVALPATGVVLVAGDLLLGQGLDFDLTVHLAVSAAARRRRTPADQHWILPALDRYDAEVDPSAIADVVVRYDDPARPAVRSRH